MESGTSMKVHSSPTELNEVVFARKGVKNVSIFTEGSDREHVTLLGGGNACGRMAPPLVLYSGTCYVKSRLLGTENECCFGFNAARVIYYAVCNEYFEKEVIPALTAQKVQYLSIYSL